MTIAEIDSVLSASNHYEVLDIQPEDASDAAKLRTAYLRRSVKVHPDKNEGVPEATQAFQKVTQAYNVLSDEQSRRQYEKYGEQPSTSSREEPFYAGSTTTGPSFQDAMFVFASVASMMAGARAGAAVDVAQAMYFAESFLSKDKSIDLSDGKGKAQAAMAAGASLRVVGSAVRAMGFKKSAAVLESGASLVQMAGIGAMVADTPAVKKALEEPSVKRTIDAGSKTMSQLGESLAAALQGMAKSRGVEGQSSQSAPESTNHDNSRSSRSGQQAPQQQQQQQQQHASRSTANSFHGSTDDADDSFTESVKKAKAAGASAGSLRRGAEAARKMGFHKKAADLEHAAEMAELAGKAAKMADNPMVKNAMQQPAVKRMVEDLFEHAMKHGTSRTNA
ncbi:hypothetical protein ACA910_013627 [Epithemia clementina (nom. ined.)]